MKNNRKSKLRNIVVVILALIVINFIVDAGSGLLNFAVSAALFVAIVYASCLLFKMIFSNKSEKATREMPQLTKEKVDHYSEFGMSEQEIEFFRETMATAKQNIAELENNMNEVAKLKAINLRYDTLKASKAMFKEIVKEPNKLHQSDRFLYNHLPNLVELTSKYVEINNHELKNKNTFDALNQSAEAIEEVSQLIVKDYSDFVSDDLDDLDVEISIAKQNIDREKELDEYRQKKEQI
ncbi:MAG: 5-bromo-4-chloroindolyl phosphate hydrolysis family protein [Vagococcus sp.]|uniref:5-bromo-4-chloroindolyl phosphate hydrolysis family protein n=1 Tax=Vagococcus sp. TaxID=1933889 RepID=UPI002FCB51DF